MPRFSPSALAARRTSASLSSTSSSKRGGTQRVYGTTTGQYHYYNYSSGASDSASGRLEHSAAAAAAAAATAHSADDNKQNKPPTGAATTAATTILIGKRQPREEVPELDHDPSTFSTIPTTEGSFDNFFSAGGSLALPFPGKAEERYIDPPLPSPSVSPSSSTLASMDDDDDDDDDDDSDNDNDEDQHVKEKFMLKKRQELLLLVKDQQQSKKVTTLSNITSNKNNKQQYQDKQPGQHKRDELEWFQRPRDEENEERTHHPASDSSSQAPATATVAITTATNIPHAAASLEDLEQEADGDIPSIQTAESFAFEDNSAVWSDGKLGSDGDADVDVDVGDEQDRRKGYNYDDDDNNHQAQRSEEASKLQTRRIRTNVEEYVEMIIESKNSIQEHLVKTIPSTLELLASQGVDISQFLQSAGSFCEKKPSAGTTLIANASLPFVKWGPSKEEEEEEEEEKINTEALQGEQEEHYHRHHHNSSISIGNYQLTMDSSSSSTSGDQVEEREELEQKQSKGDSFNEGTVHNPGITDAQGSAHCLENDECPENTQEHSPRDPAEDGSETKMEQKDQNESPSKSVSRHANPYPRLPERTATTQPRSPLLFSSSTASASDRFAAYRIPRLSSPIAFHHHKQHAVPKDAKLSAIEEQIAELTRQRDIYCLEKEIADLRATIKALRCAEAQREAAGAKSALNNNIGTGGGGGDMINNDNRVVELEKQIGNLRRRKEMSRLEMHLERLLLMLEGLRSSGPQRLRDDEQGLAATSNSNGRQDRSDWATHHQLNSSKASNVQDEQQLSTSESDDLWEDTGTEYPSLESYRSRSTILEEALSEEYSEEDEEKEESNDESEIVESRSEDSSSFISSEEDRTRSAWTGPDYLNEAYSAEDSVISADLSFNDKNKEDAESGHFFALPLVNNFAADPFGLRDKLLCTVQNDFNPFKLAVGLTRKRTGKRVTFNPVLQVSDYGAVVYETEDDDDDDEEEEEEECQVTLVDPN